MKRSFSTFVVACVSLCLLTTGCEQTSEDSGSTGASFTAAGIAKLWTGSCGSGTDAITGATSYRPNVRFFADGTYSSSILWYPNNNCSGLISVMYTTTGTFAIGSDVGNAKELTFTANASYIMVGTTAEQTDFNNDCGMTSPYDNNVSSGNNGASESSYMFNCQSMDFPNSGNKTIENIATYDGTTLTMGVWDPGIPGAFSANTVPNSVSWSFY